MSDSYEDSGEFDPSFYKNANDLAYDWAWTEQPDVAGFRIRGGSVVWTDCEWTARVEDRVRIGRIIPTLAGLKVITRYIDPSTPITLEKVK